MKVSLTKVEEHVVEESPVEASYSLTDDLRLIIERVEALDKTDERIKAIGKLKGALELLS